MPDELASSPATCHEPTLEPLLERYRQAVADLAVVPGNLPVSQAVETLCLREAVERRVRSDELPLDFDSFSRLVQADAALRRLAPRLAALEELPTWRKAFAPAEEAWWWFPDQGGAGHWKSLSLLFGCLSVTFVIEIISRFGTGNIDLFGGAFVVLTTVLTALSAGGVLSKTLEASSRAGLSAWGVPVHRHPAVLTCIAAATLLIALVTWLSLPRISIFYNNRGAAALKLDHPADAEAYLRRALRLDPNNVQAHYNLGEFHERLERRKEAIEEYGLAAAGGLDLAANNLGRLLILDGRPAEAVQVLLPLEQRTRGESIEPSARYRILKNLGWARLAQGRPTEALDSLKAAVGLLPQSAPAHCLLGRAFARLGDRERAAQFWTGCLTFARELDPDEDRWIGEADQFFEENTL